MLDISGLFCQVSSCWICSQEGVETSEFYCEVEYCISTYLHIYISRYLHIYPNQHIPVCRCGTAGRSAGTATCRPTTRSRGPWWPSTGPGWGGCWWPPGTSTPGSSSSPRTSAAYDPSVSQSVFTITEKAPTRAFSWLKAPTSAFTFKTLLRHYANHPAHPL